MDYDNKISAHPSTSGWEDVNFTGERNVPKLEKITTSLDGDPKKGIIHHLAYVHEAPWGTDLDDLSDLGKRRASLIHQIKKLNVPHCYLEGHIVGRDTFDTLVVAEKQTEDLKALFADRELPLLLSKLQAAILGQNELEVSIKYFCPETEIRGTEPADGRLARVSNKDKNEENRQALTLHYREFIALDEIISNFERDSQEKKSCVLIYGAAHEFESEDLPARIPHTEAPLILKYHFEPCSIFDASENVISATSEDAQLNALYKAERIFDYIFSRALSPQVQLVMLPKLKSNPDSTSSPEDLFKKLVTFLKDGDGAKEVLQAIISTYEYSTGPFSDIALRQNIDQELKLLEEGRASLAVASERHPYTQLEFIQRAPSLESPCFSKILSEKGQLIALPKIILPECITISRQQAIDGMYFYAISDKVRALVTELSKSPDWLMELPPTKS